MDAADLRPKSCACLSRWKTHHPECHVEVAARGLKHRKSTANPDWPYEHRCVECGEEWPCQYARAESSKPPRSQEVLDALADAETYEMNRPLASRVRVAETATGDHDTVPVYTPAGSRVCIVCVARAIRVEVPALRGER